MDDELPKQTVRDISIVLVALFEIAIDRARRALDQLRPFVEPPEDLRIVGANGVVFSGVVVIERGVVVAGIIVEVGRVMTAAPAPREPLVTPPPRFETRGRFERDDRDARLPGWGEDPRAADMFDEDRRWRR